MTEPAHRLWSTEEQRWIYPDEPRGTGYTHEQLWALAHRWYDISNNETVEEHVRESFAECANELTELLGPLAFAAAAGLGKPQ